MAGYQTGYHPQRTLVNGGGLWRTDRQVSGVCDERQRPVVNGTAFHGMQEARGSSPLSSTFPQLRGHFWSAYLIFDRL
jgi:hypothetical protein